MIACLCVIIMSPSFQFFPLLLPQTMSQIQIFFALFVATEYVMDGKAMCNVHDQGYLSGNHVLYAVMLNDMN